MERGVFAVMMGAEGESDVMGQPLRGWVGSSCGPEVPSLRSVTSGYSWANPSGLNSRPDSVKRCKNLLTLTLRETAECSEPLASW